MGIGVGSGQGKPVAVKQGKPFFQVAETRAGFSCRRRVLGQPVFGAKNEVVVFAGQGKADLVTLGSPVDAMFKKILHEGHQQHRGDEQLAFEMFMKGHVDAVADADLFEGDVVLEKFDFRGQGYFLLGAFVHEIAHDIGEAADEQGGPGGFAIRLIIDIVEGVEQKMWLYLGFEQVEFGVAFLFEHLFGLAFYPEVGEGDAKHEAEHKGHESGQREIEELLWAESLFLFGEVIIIDAQGKKGMGHAGEGEEEEGGQYVPDDPSFFVQAGKEKADVTINDQGVEAGIDKPIDRSLGEAVLRKIGEDGKKENEAPHQEL